MEERVILVDDDDRPVGTAEKMDAHRRGRLHRAVSVFVFNSEGALLIQRRAMDKYHSGGLWSNTCCSHPRPGEDTLDAARRRLREEMGIDCALTPVHRFVYRAELDGGLCEHEYDHVFFGRCDVPPAPDPREVADWRWSPVPAVLSDVVLRPWEYTVWFGLALSRLEGEHLLEGLQPGRA